MLLVLLNPGTGKTIYGAGNQSNAYLWESLLTGKILLECHIDVSGG
jgi:hypothetical protein